MTFGRWLGWLAVAGLAGCGGKTVVDGTPGDGGSGGATTTTATTTWTTTATATTTWTTTATTTTTTSTGDGCVAHGQCESGLCIFSSGVCSTSCTMTEPCGTGLRCEPCATSSCPTCEDCVGACVTAAPGECDDHDDCTADDLCVYWSQRCAPPCTSAGGCADANLWCDTCATYPCPMCAECWSACVPYGEQ